MAIVIKASGNRKDWPRSHQDLAPHDDRTSLSDAVVFAAVNRDTDLTRGGISQQYEESKIIVLRTPTLSRGEPKIPLGARLAPVTTPIQLTLLQKEER